MIEKLHNTLVRLDVLEWLRPLWESGAWLLNEEGKLYRRQKFIETIGRHAGFLRPVAGCPSWRGDLGCRRADPGL